MGIRDKLKTLPDNSGVYIYYGASGEVLYVGKAKNLKNRVRQYFMQSAGKTSKVHALMEKAVDFRFIVTPSERDALALESTLIKKYMPPYNILLKDDRHFPYVRIDTDADYPRLTVTRKIEKDGARYFGPIIGNLRGLIQLLRDLFPLAVCSHNLARMPDNFRPCLNYHIHRCLAPCAARTTPEEYGKAVSGAIDFLNGDDKAIVEELTRKMSEAAENGQYETGLKYKEQLTAIAAFRQKTICQSDRLFDADIYAVNTDGASSAVSQTLVRGGKTVHSECFDITDGSLDGAQNLASFLSLYYSLSNDISAEILVNVELHEKKALEELLSEQFNRAVRIKNPKKGEKKKLIEMGMLNAYFHISNRQTAAEKKHNATLGAVDYLYKTLSLSSPPLRIECFDISNISGVDKVASMVVFTNGEKNTKAYRRFKIKTVEGADDFASMNEVLSRRFARLNDGDFGERPDLIVVDGGKGQLSSAVKALNDVGESIDIISLAKKREEVFLRTGELVNLPRDSNGLKLLIGLRDEAHRFAITYFRSLHSKNALKSRLDDIKGVGKKRSVSILRGFRNVEELSHATVDEIIEKTGVDKTTAKNIYEHFKPID